ncbi:MAG: hypothetical protein JNK70_09060 [Phycisphaerae bacterium]|nr:hypothetical protein [Phycisphaerae bacterium]
MGSRQGVTRGRWLAAAWAAIPARRPFAEIEANKDGEASYEEVVAAFRAQRGGAGVGGG